MTFAGDTFDTGVCHMAFFADPDGNALMLHHRYTPPRVDGVPARAERQGAPMRVSISAPQRAPTCAAPRTSDPEASPNVNPAANESPQP